MDTKKLIEWDREFVWHPFTPMKPWCENKDIVVIERGEREFLIDTEGNRYIDGVSSHVVQRARPLRVRNSMPR